MDPHADTEQIYMVYRWRKRKEVAFFLFFFRLFCFLNPPFPVPLCLPGLWRSAPWFEPAWLHRSSRSLFPRRQPKDSAYLCALFTHAQRQPFFPVARAWSSRGGFFFARPERGNRFAALMERGFFSSPARARVVQAQPPTRGWARAQPQRRIAARDARPL
nr:hypothetical protein [Pandoravirus belohorizontensis]